MTPEIRTLRHRREEIASTFENSVKQSKYGDRLALVGFLGILVCCFTSYKEPLAAIIVITGISALYSHIRSKEMKPAYAKMCELDALISNKSIEFRKRYGTK